MFDDLLKLVLSEADGDRAMNDLVARWNIDRWFSFSGMLESCKYDVGKMKEYGFDEARVEKFPADGRTTFGYWRMPLAWDPVDATLTIASPAAQAGKVLAHYKSVPCGLAMWTPATPAGGVEGEVVALDRGDRDADYAGLNVRGKFILTNLRGSAVRNQAIKRRALGVISDTSRWPLEQPDAVDWMNAWSEDPSGWGLTAGEKSIIGFNLSHRRGRELRALIARGPTRQGEAKRSPVRLRAVSDARNYSGVMPVATGAIRGKTREEVLTLGHGAEQGAVDNSSGCACMLEALRALKSLIDAGRLPRPRRSIRMLITWEVYATLAFVETHRARAGRTVAGLCLDSVAQAQSLTTSPLGIHRNPHANSSCVDTLIKLLAEKLWPAPARSHHWFMVDYSMTDNVTAHPGIGIPTPWLGILGHRQWHTSEDTPDKIDVRALKEVSALTAAYLYFLANAHEGESAWLADAASADRRVDITRAGVELAAALAQAASAEELARRLAAARERVDYLHALAKMSVHSVRRLAPRRSAKVEKAIDRAVSMLSETVGGEREHIESAARDAAAERGWKLAEPLVPPTGEMARAADMIVRRARTGPVAFDGIPLARRRGLDDSRWGGPLQNVLMWCDGKRTLAEAVRMASSEMNQTLTGIVEQVERCAKLGLVKVTAPR